MEQVYSKLTELGLEDDVLPTTIQTKINKLDGLINAMNEEIENLEKEGLTQDEIDDRIQETDESIDQLESTIVEEIVIWHKNQAAPIPEKNGSGWGWAIFGGLALVLTLGAVNVMQKN